MKATTLTTRTFEMMYYETRGAYCNPAEKFLSYTEFKRMFEPALSRGCNINELATAIYNKAIDNGATEEAALHAALFVFSFTAGKQAAKKWFDGLVAKQSDDTQENDNSDDGSNNSNPEPEETPENDNSDDGSNNSNPEPDDTQENDNSDDNSEVKKELELFGEDLEIYLKTHAMFDDTKNGAFVPIMNEYRINCINHIRKLKKNASKKITELLDAVIAALKDAESGAKVLLELCEYFSEATLDMTNEEQRTKVLEILKDYLPKSEPEEDPKDPDPKGPSDSGAIVIEPVEVVETPTVANGIDPVNKKSIPDVEEAYTLNGKEFSDSDLVTTLKDNITVLEGRNVSRNSINMLLNLVMNNQDGFVTKLIDLGAKIPLEIKEVEVTKYTTDKKRFDTIFEVTTANVNAPIVFFYHWDPILNKEGTAWAYDALVLPFDKVTLTKDAKKAKADSKRQKKTKKQTTEQPAPQPQAMTATA